MLGTLLKYELKATGRIMLPLYLVLIIATGVLGLSIRMGNEKNMGLLSIVVIFLFIIAVIAVLIVSVMMVLQRFYKNLLGTEGYLMFTLPVTTWGNIISKALASLIWIIGGMIAGALSGCLFIFVLNGWHAFTSQLGYLWELIASQNPSMDVVRSILMILVISLAGLMATVMKVYASMAVGHQWSDHRILGSILAYVGFGIIEVVIARFLPFYGSMAMFTGEEVAVVQGTTIYAQLGINQSIGWLALGISLLQMLIYAVITWYLLDRRLNLE